jgi:hypothetical protein
MATMGLRGLWPWGGSSHDKHASDSKKARKVVHEAHVRSGGPTPELKRVYGEYLEYKRAKNSTAKG